MEKKDKKKPIKIQPAVERPPKNQVVVVTESFNPISKIPKKDIKKK